MSFTKWSSVFFSKANIKLEYLICGEEVIEMRGVRNFAYINSVPHQFRSDILQ